MKSTALFFVSLAGLIIIGISGCETGYETDKPEMVVESEAAIEPETIIEAVEEKNGIAVGCVVTYFGEGGSLYISEQSHRIYPQSQKLIISAKEPGGEVLCMIAGQDYVVQADDPVAFEAVYSRAALRALFNAVLAGADLLDMAGAERLKEVKLDGRWYNPLVIESASPDWAKITYFKNIDSSQIDMLLVEDLENDTARAAQTYNYRNFGPEKSFPMKVDILRYEKRASGSVSLRRILEIAYKYPVNWD